MQDLSLAKDRDVRGAAYDDIATRVMVLSNFLTDEEAMDLPFTIHVEPDDWCMFRVEAMTKYGGAMSFSFLVQDKENLCATLEIEVSHSDDAYVVGSLNRKFYNNTDFMTLSNWELESIVARLDINDHVPNTVKHLFVMNGRAFFVSYA